MNNRKVMIGMSGGVDSSVAAYLLKEQGYEVVGVTMQIWQEEKEENGSCCSLTAVEDARRVATKLDIPYYVLNFKKVFDEKVIQYFISEYLKGRTPNPCIACNRYIKFEELLNKAISMGIDYVSTGHYAKVEEHNGRYLLKKGIDSTKDQSYVLYNLTQEQLSKCVFPLGDLKKDEVRNIARKLELIVADKPDSQEICFVEDNNYGRFIEENSDTKSLEGNIVDTKGNILGTHKGIYHYTIGQRKGIRIASNIPWYVVDIDVDKNEVIVGEENDIYMNELVVKDINWISIDELKNDMKVTAKIRYGGQEANATISTLDNNNVLVKFDEKQRAITPGQSVVFYNEDIVVGGGIIV